MENQKEEQRKGNGCSCPNAKGRADGLAKYIGEKNRKGKKVFGDVVIKDKDSWRLNDSKKYQYDPRNLQG